MRESSRLASVMTVVNTGKQLVNAFHSYVLAIDSQYRGPLASAGQAYFPTTTAVRHRQQSKYALEHQLLDR